MQRFAAGAAGLRNAEALVHRDDVDGLRAIAVLAILGFHLNLAGFSGGFVGVDVFFVISGYVILRSILPAIDANRFSLADFFIRRARRILPALTVVLAATMAVGFVILSPAELAELAESAVATTAFAANFYFHDRTGYFASAAYTRPLLHMWSLGIEEQFYILVPLSLAVLMRTWRIAAGWPIALLALGSFAYGLAAPTAIGEKHAFYMPMARFWEIAIGGCVAVAERRWGLLRRGNGGIASLGLMAIASAILLLNSDSGGQQWAAIAVLGTAAVIAAGGSNENFAAAMLASRPMVGIGRISYSMYLVHWPLIVFWRLYTAHPLRPHEQVLLLVLTIALAAALSVLVETPMRAGSHQIGNRPALAGIFMATVAVAVLGVAAVADRGAVWRMNPRAKEALSTLRTAVAERPRCVSDKQWMTPPFTACRWNPGRPGTDFVIWGDSHAGALAPELAPFLVEGGKKSGVSVGMHCSPIQSIVLADYNYAKNCPAYVDAVIEAIARERPSLVVIAGRWAVLESPVPAPGTGESSGRILDLENKRTPMRLADALSRTIDRVRASGARVILVGPVPEIEYDVPPTLVRALRGIGELPRVRRADFDRRQQQVLGALAEMHAQKDVPVVYPHDVLCDASTCSVSDGLRSFYLDHDHLSPFGSLLVGGLVRSVIGSSALAQAGLGVAVEVRRSAR
jgi:peptidoglycan/LPS O-acetylase OafA/YrhL